MSEGVLSEGCTTCGDVAIPMRVADVDRQTGLALCLDADGAGTSVETALVEPVLVGEVLLVHAGTALSRAPEEAGAR